MVPNLPSHLRCTDERQRGQPTLAHSSSLGSFSGSGSRTGGLGSRHNSHSLLKQDAINDWLSSSDAASLERMPATPTGHCEIDAFIMHDPVGGGFGLMHDVGSPIATWSSMLDGTGRGMEEGIDKSWGGSDLELKASSLIANLHVDDLFNDNASTASSNYGGGVTLNLPGWNNGPDFGLGPMDSDADSPDVVWGLHANVPAKSLRRSAKLGTMVSVDALQEAYGSPGAGFEVGSTGITFVTSPPCETMSPLDAATSLLAPPRSLRQCISAPQLQNTDSVLVASDFLTDSGFAGDGKTAMGPSFSLTASADLLGVSDAGSQPQPSNSLGTAPTMSISTASSGMPSNSSQPSALFQRRANQREGNLAAPAPVATGPPQSQGGQPAGVVPTGGGQSDGSDQSRFVNVPLSELTAADFESMTEEQRLRLAQVHQLHVAQQAARLGVYSDFVAPSQQFAGQEASERAAKAVQAALLYGMEGNGPRRLSAGSTGLPTPITPQHPLVPGPATAGYAAQPPFPLQSYRIGAGALGGRMPGMPMSAIETSFPHSIYHPDLSQHHHHQQQQQMLPTPYYQQQGGYLMGQQAPQDMSGYTSTYPPPRNDMAGSSDVTSHFQHQQQQAATGTVGGAAGSTLHDRSQPRSAPSDLASEIAANPMQLQVPFVALSQSEQQPQQQQQMDGIDSAAVQLHQPVAQRPLMVNYQHSSDPSSSSQFQQEQLPQAAQQQDQQFTNLSQVEPRSAPADIGKGQMSMQDQQKQQYSIRMQQQFLVQQQLQQHQQQQRQEEHRRHLKSKASMPAITSRKHQPTLLAAPLSPPRSPSKMKSSPQLRRSNSPSGSSNSGKSSTASIRKIASNRRINASAAAQAAMVPSLPTSTLTKGAAQGKTRALTLDGSGASVAAAAAAAVAASGSGSPGASSLAPSSRRLRTMSHASLASSSSYKSKSPTPAPGASMFNFSSLSFVNYGMEDAEELCSAVAPSGSYKVPLKGYGSSGSGSDYDEDDDDVEMQTSGAEGAATPRSGSGAVGESGSSSGSGSCSPVKKARRSRTISRAGSASPLKSKRSVASIGASSNASTVVGGASGGSRQRSASRSQGA